MDIPPSIVGITTLPLSGCKQGRREFTDNLTVLQVDRYRHQGIPGTGTTDTKTVLNAKHRAMHGTLDVLCTAVEKLIR
jgi:hypothetical protein